jgi:hypothetical protein
MAELEYVAYDVHLSMHALKGECNRNVKFGQRLLHFVLYYHNVDRYRFRVEPDRVQCTVDLGI